MDRQKFKGVATDRAVNDPLADERFAGQLDVASTLGRLDLATPRLPAAPSWSFVAIDIGRTGALAWFGEDGDLLEISDMPVLADGPASRPTVNGPLLGAQLAVWRPSRAVCEHVSARPGEAPSGAFAFGRSRGVVEGVLAARAIPVRFVTPAWWKRRAGIPPGRDHKDTARSVAIARWPHLAHLFSRKLDHDRAEAALIGAAFVSECRQ